MPRWGKTPSFPQILPPVHEDDGLLLCRAIPRWPETEPTGTLREAQIVIESDRPPSVFGGRTPDEVYATQANEEKLAA